MVNCLEIALEHSVDDKARDVLIKAEKAATALMYMMDNLLKLTETENGPVHPVDEIFNPINRWASH